LLDNIRVHHNVRLRFLRSVSALTEPSLGEKFKVHWYVNFFINECNSYSRIPSCTSYCGARHGLAVCQWSLYIVNTLWWKCILTQTFHVQFLDCISLMMKLAEGSMI